MLHCSIRAIQLIWSPSVYFSVKTQTADHTRQRKHTCYLPQNTSFYSLFACLRFSSPAAYLISLTSSPMSDLEHSGDPA
jgi:hypothetical protein